MSNTRRAYDLIQKYGFDFSGIDKQEIRDLLKHELNTYISVLWYTKFVTPLSNMI